MELNLNRSFLLRYILQFLIAVVFIISSYLKLYPIEPFELTLVDSGLISWTLAPYIARILISLEAIIGIALLVNTRFSIYFLKSALYLTLFFCVYLLLLWYFRGNDINCGCFGNNFAMTPVESLLKNAVILLITLLAIRLYKPNNFGLGRLYVIGSLVLLGLPFILNPLASFHSSPDNTEYPYKFDTELIPDSIYQQVPKNLLKGEHLVAFLSVTCPHCRVAAQKIRVANQELDIPPVFAFFIGDESKMADFEFESGTKLNYIMYRDNSFFKFNNGVLPTVLLVKDGQVLRRWSGGSFNYDEIAKIPTYLQYEDLPSSLE